MMQLVVPEALSFPCAKLVKAMAALISLQYVSSLPFTFSFCTAPPPLMIASTQKTCTRKEQNRARGVRGQVQLVMDENRGFDLGCEVKDSPLTCHIYLIHDLWFLKVQEEEKTG